LAAKERLCEELDALMCSGGASAPLEAESVEAQSAAAQERWTALLALPAAWEKKLLSRRDAALGALSDAAAGGKYLARIEQGAGSRREGLLELELLLGLESPPEFQPQRLALQVKQLRDRFQSARTTGAVTAGERLLAWCAQPGVADALDRQRCERIFSKVEQTR
jgi:putative intracellular protease/amidase